MTRIEIHAPYLLYLGDVPDAPHAKTALGIAHWRGQDCAGQMRLPGCPIDAGLPELDVAGARAAGVRTAIIGVAPSGGQVQANWLPQLCELARAGIDLAAGLHSRLNAMQPLVDAAEAGGARLIDVRVPPAGIPVGTGRKRSGRRVLMVGSDCAVGKKYSALALHRALAARGQAATFRATGQTGIMIAGSGMPMDCVVSDFLAGAAEVLSPDNDPDHWDVIEGQGALTHPSYAGVALGLLHGSQPDALVLCHDVARTHTLGVEAYPIPPLDEVIDMNLRAGRLTNPDVRCVGVSVNTSSLTDAEREACLAELADTLGLPCVDPVATGMAPIADALGSL